MSWYVLQCRTGQEGSIIRSCTQHLSSCALKKAFVFQCERLWRSNGIWKLVEKEMFPGYIFLESDQPELLSKELDRYRNILRVMEEPGYLISVYEEEEQNFRKLCGENHCLKVSYGYKSEGVDHITRGPLKGQEDRIVRVDWHRRFAKVGITVAGKETLVWAGLDLDNSVVKSKDSILVS